MAILYQILPLVLIFGLFFFMIILPEKKRKKQYSQMMDALQVNDEIMTRGGIVGKIVQMDEEHVVIETSSDRTKIKLVRNSIASKVYKEEAKA
ncbi:preprotein translocase subunit YajC [Clostridium sardiniense]|uniref:Preprotein translocase subunit YajC n=1 Tax=Clostridium sardiniense TaxID=29369 RepID=A0ABS7KX09_CLOSR|nr:preprotein translocase subunit YajC [Clostridium sardiniense]MBM7834273.1 preprotein translocase subunit YajC [Clostridium sardiniense]MBY0755117.1 preprotein translocase subunit YajC [Clostridium sardiniense]MDQ0459025.1 preprotein translocase subunit YajC [Clostridium sardiniense]